MTIFTFNVSLLFKKRKVHFKILIRIKIPFLFMRNELFLEMVLHVIHNKLEQSYFILILIICLVIIANAL